MSNESAYPHKISVPRKHVCERLGITKMESYRLFSPRRARGIVLYDDVMNLLRSCSRNGASAGCAIPQLVGIARIAEISGLSTRHAHDFVRRSVPHFHISNKTVLVNVDDFTRALTKRTYTKRNERKDNEQR